MGAPTDLWALNSDSPVTELLFCSFTHSADGNTDQKKNDGKEEASC